jgi:hypothetical protein
VLKLSYKASLSIFMMPPRVPFMLLRYLSTPRNLEFEPIIPPHCMTSVPNQWLTLRLARSNRVIDAVVTSTVISDKRVFTKLRPSLEKTNADSVDGLVTWLTFPRTSHHPSQRSLTYRHTSLLKRSFLTVFDSQPFRYSGCTHPKYS